MAYLRWLEQKSLRSGNLKTLQNDFDYTKTHSDSEYMLFYQKAASTNSDIDVVKNSECEIDYINDNDEHKKFIEKYETKTIFISPLKNRFHCNVLFKKIITFINKTFPEVKMTNVEENIETNAIKLVSIVVDTLNIFEKDKFYRFCYENTSVRESEYCKKVKSKLGLSSTTVHYAYKQKLDKKIKQQLVNEIDEILNKYNALVFELWTNIVLPYISDVQNCVVLNMLGNDMRSYKKFLSFMTNNNIHKMFVKTKNCLCWEP